MPRAGGIGGGGFMLVYLEKNKEIFFIDYRSKSPLNTNLKDIFKYDDVDKKNYVIISKNVITIHKIKSSKFCA